MSRGNKLERYFGLRVKIEEEADPHLLTAIIERFDRYANIVGFKAEEHFVYIHTLSVSQTDNKGYFGKNVLIEDRIDKLRANFRVNQKQAKTPGLEKIRFIDAFTLSTGESDWLDKTSKTSVEWEYPGSFFVGRAKITTNIVTWVSKTLRRDSFKKVKLLLTATPTNTFARALKASVGISNPTAFDIPLTYSKDIRFRLASLSDEEREKIKKSFHKNEESRKIEDAKRIAATNALKMNENERLQQPFISIQGNVSGLQIVANSSQFTATQLGRDGLQLSSVLEAMLLATQERLPNSPERTKLEEAIVTASAAKNKTQFLESYKKIVELVQPTYEILSDFIPKLTQFL